jgi:transposase InsO family protein
MSEGYDAVLVIVDRFTKMAHFAPAMTTDNAQMLAKRFTQEVVRLHGIPTDIVLDWGPTFKAEWWKEYCKAIGVQLKMSTAYHPQTDGQTERTHQSFKHML